jgi:hypothetical protein
MATPLGPFFWNAAMCMGSTSMGSTAAPRPSRRHVESLLFRQQKLPLLLGKLGRLTQQVGQLFDLCLRPLPPGTAPAPWPGSCRRRQRLFRVEHVVGEDVGPREHHPAAEQPPVRVGQGLRGLHEPDAAA